LSLNQGSPIVEADPDAPVARAMLALVQRLAPASAGDAKSKRRRATPFRRKQVNP
jgi:hypothetical protein